MSELMKRSVFGVMYVALMLWAVLTPEAIVFCVVFSVLAFLGVWEYSTLVGLHRTRPLRVILDGLAAVALIIGAHQHNMAILAPYILYFLYIIIRSMYSERAEQPAGLAKNIFGQAYVAFPLAIMAWVHSFSFFTFKGGAFLLILLVGIWANDTGAYIVGSKFGRRKLFPKLSPKKSWEGFFGGMLFSVLAVAIVYALQHKGLSLKQDWFVLVIGVLISVFATWGDLFESMLKRNAGVKDSGAIIPGHGGILDRIDSILFVAPWVTLCTAAYVGYKVSSLFSFLM